jgi:hypothetical protein
LIPFFALPFFGIWPFLFCFRLAIFFGSALPVRFCVIQTAPLFFSFFLYFTRSPYTLSFTLLLFICLFGFSGLFFVFSSFCFCLYFTLHYASTHPFPSRSLGFACVVWEGHVGPAMLRSAGAVNMLRFQHRAQPLFVNGSALRACLVSQGPAWNGLAWTHKERHVSLVSRTVLDIQRNIEFTMCMVHIWCG